MRAEIETMIGEIVISMVEGVVISMATGRVAISKEEIAIPRAEGDVIMGVAAEVNIYFFACKESNKHAIFVYFDMRKET